MQLQGEKKIHKIIKQISPTHWKILIVNVKKIAKNAMKKLSTQKQSLEHILLKKQTIHNHKTMQSIFKGRLHQKYELLWNQTKDWA